MRNLFLVVILSLAGCSAITDRIDLSGPDSLRDCHNRCNLVFSTCLNGQLAQRYGTPNSMEWLQARDYCERTLATPCSRGCNARSFE